MARWKLGNPLIKNYRRKLDVLYVQYLSEVLKELRKNPEVDLAIKLPAIKSYAINRSIRTRDIASVLDINETSITRWVKIWNENQTEGLENRVLVKRYEKILDKICKKTVRKAQAGRGKIINSGGFYGKRQESRKKSQQSREAVYP